MTECDGCETSTPKHCSEHGRCLARKDMEMCEECMEWFLMSKMQDENIIEESQYHPYGSTVARETYVIGFVCPTCGHRNQF